MIGYTVCFKLLTSHWDYVVFPLLVAISSPRAYSGGSMTWLSVVMMLTMVVTMTTTMTMVMVMIVMMVAMRTSKCQWKEEEGKSSKGVCVLRLRRRRRQLSIMMIGGSSKTQYEGFVVLSYAVQLM